MVVNITTGITIKVTVSCQTSVAQWLNVHPLTKSSLLDSKSGHMPALPLVGGM